MHFFGKLIGRSATAAVREGTKHSGLLAELGSNSGRVTLRLSYKGGRDVLEIWHQATTGSETLVYRGSLSEFKPESI